MNHPPPTQSGSRLWYSCDIIPFLYLSVFVVVNLRLFECLYVALQWNFAVNLSTYCFHGFWLWFSDELTVVLSFFTRLCGDGLNFSVFINYFRSYLFCIIRWTTPNNTCLSAHVLHSTCKCSIIIIMSCMLYCTIII